MAYCFLVSIKAANRRWILRTAGGTKLHTLLSTDRYGYFRIVAPGGDVVKAQVILRDPSLCNKPSLI